MKTHLRHVVLFVAAIAMLAVLGMRLSLPAVLAVAALCLVLVEGGLWVIHRRDRTHASTGGR